MKDGKRNKIKTDNDNVWLPHVEEDIVNIAT